MKAIVLPIMLGILASCGQHKPAETYETDSFVTKSGKTVKFHALVHASIRIEFDGKEIEIDPVRKLGNKTIDYSKMPKADYIFVAHEHMDHFDKEAIKRAGLDDASVAELPEKIRVKANRVLPVYSKLQAFEIQEEEFMKTPKRSIKRYLYK